MSAQRGNLGTRENASDSADRHRNTSLRLLQALGLSWVLKVFLGLAQFTHLDHEHDAWDQTTDRSEAGGQMGTPGLWERGV